MTDSVKWPILPLSTLRSWNKFSVCLMWKSWQCPTTFCLKHAREQIVDMEALEFKAEELCLQSTRTSTFPHGKKNGLPWQISWVGQSNSKIYILLHMWSAFPSRVMQSNSTTEEYLAIMLTDSVQYHKARHYKEICFGLTCWRLICGFEYELSSESIHQEACLDIIRGRISFYLPAEIKDI